MIATLTACGNGGASEPPVTSLDPAAISKLQFAVGVATMSYNNGTSVAIGLNTVETLRQQNGLSGTLYNVPMIIGPSGFDVSTSTETGEGVQGAGSDIGTNHITWGTLNQSVWLSGAQRGPKQSTTGAFGYGLCPCNSDSGPGNGFTPLFQAYNLPIYGNVAALASWYGGPPAFPAAGPQLVAKGWEGYSLGFTDFAVTPVIGTYHLYAAVPPAFNTPQNPTPSPGTRRHPDSAAGRSRSRRTADQPHPAAGVHSDAGAATRSPRRRHDRAHGAARRQRSAGGSSARCAAAAKPAASAYWRTPADAYYTVVTNKRGPQTLALADDLGPLTQSGAKSATICSEGSYSHLRHRRGLATLRIFVSQQPRAVAVDQRTERPGRHHNLRRSRGDVSEVKGAAALRMTVLVAASLIAACGGGGDLPAGSVVNSPGGGPTQSPTKLVNVKVTVTIPAPKPRGVRPDYVSENTQSLVIALSSVNGQGVSGVNPTTINTLAHSSGCKTGPSGTICSATASGSPGDDVFGVTTYANTNATGAVLSFGTVEAKISGSNSGVNISNQLSLTLDGVIASLEVTLSPNEAKRGAPAKSAVALSAFDATGAQIVGPSKFASPITLAIEGDSVRAFSLHAGGRSGSSLSIVQPTSGITMDYDGNEQASSIAVQASVDGPSVSKTAKFTVHGKTPPPPVGTIYALNLGSNDGQGATVTVYDGNVERQREAGAHAPTRLEALRSQHCG